jgi:hypothetical protein
VLQYDTQRDANNEILTTLERLEEANHLLQQQNQDYERSMVELRAVPTHHSIHSIPSTCACAVVCAVCA